MPKIERDSNHTPAPKQPVRKSSVSILDEAIDIDQLESLYVKLCLYGGNRVGKTTLAAQFPKPLLLIDCEPGSEGGAKSVKNIEGIIHLRVKTKAKFLQVIDELAQNDLKWPAKWKGQLATIVLDSATSMQDIVLKELLGLSHVPEQLNWGMVSRDQYRERSEITRETLRPLLDLSVNTVVNCKEKDHNPPDKEKPEILRGIQLESFFAAELGGATVGWLHDNCGYIGRLSIEKVYEEETTTVPLQGGKSKTKVITRDTGKTIRRLRTMLHPNYAAGFRSENPSAVPDWIECPSPQQMYQAVCDVVAGKKTKYGVYNNNSE